MKSLPWYALVVSVAIISVFGWMCYHMIIQSAVIDNESHRFQWDRLMSIFNVVQAMAAAAVGALLGTTVQQARVQTAQAQAVGAIAKVEAARELVDTLQPPGGEPDSRWVALRRVLQAAPAPPA
jgi:hypothetical protein